MLGRMALSALSCWRPRRSGIQRKEDFMRLIDAALIGIILGAPCAAAQSVSIVPPTVLPIHISSEFTFDGPNGLALSPIAPWPQGPSMSTDFVFDQSSCDIAEGTLSIEVLNNGLEATVDTARTMTRNGMCEVNASFFVDISIPIAMQGGAVALLRLDPEPLTATRNTDGWLRIEVNQTTWEIDSVLHGETPDRPFRRAEVVWPEIGAATQIIRGTTTNPGTYGLAAPGDTLTAPFRVYFTFRSSVTGIFKARFEFVQIAPQPVSSIGPELGLPFGAVVLAGLSSLRGGEGRYAGSPD